MTFSRYRWLLILAGVATAMAIAIVVMSALNERTQRDLQVRQAALSSGVLGPQGQQIGNAILQEMAAAATTNRPMREVLKKYGYTIQPAAGDRGQETGDRGQETGVRGQETGGRGQETGDRGQETEQ
jgi:hypothetical protein